MSECNTTYKGHTVHIDGEIYVSLRHVVSLFEPTGVARRFCRKKTFWLRKGHNLGEVVEDRPSTFLEKYFGSDGKIIHR